MQKPESGYNVLFRRKRKTKCVRQPPSSCLENGKLSWKFIRVCSKSGLRNQWKKWLTPTPEILMFSTPTLS